MVNDNTPKNEVHRRFAGKQCLMASTTLLLTRRRGDTEAHPPHSTAQNRTEPKLRASVPPCETLLLLVQCSITHTTLLLTRRHKATEAYPPHSTEPKLRAPVSPCETHAPVSIVLKDPYDAISHTETRRHGGSSIVQNSTKPKLRDSVPPCETLLPLAQCSKTRTTRLLTRRHEATEA